MSAADTSKNVFQGAFSEEFRKDTITMFCSTGVKEGEMLESASPSDPLFWMIHPVLDRLLVVSHAQFATAPWHLNIVSFRRNALPSLRLLVSETTRQFPLSRMSHGSTIQPTPRFHLLLKFSESRTLKQRYL